jgi:hypothetical protein
LEKRTLRRLTQRPSSVQLWQTPAGQLIPKEASPAPFEWPENGVFPLPEEAQDASYFAAPARIANFVPKSTDFLYTYASYRARGDGNIADAALLAACCKGKLENFENSAMIPS